MEEVAIEEFLIKLIQRINGKEGKKRPCNVTCISEYRSAIETTT